MSILFAAAGIACLLYYVLICLYAGSRVNFGWFWPALGAVCLLVSYLQRFDDPVPVLVRRILMFAVCAGIVLILCISVPVIRGMYTQPPEGREYVIVLGAQVRGTRPSRALLRRLERAAQYARSNPETILILSGGQGEGEDISEARCMQEYLTAEGIPQERMILEERSTSTEENLIFSDELTGCAKCSCGILSNNFHIFRAVRYAKKIGYTDAAGIPAASDPIMQVHYVVRETAAIAADALHGAI